VDIHFGLFDLELTGGSSLWTLVACYPLLLLSELVLRNFVKCLNELF
jgi:hypothetical protein